MIVRNEERMIGQCLLSVKDFVDEIIVVDTGCDDRTVEIARSFGSKIYSHAWTNDFSEARNHSLDKATCEWILVLDADECLANRDAAQLGYWMGETHGRGLKLVQRNYLRVANFVSSIRNPRDYKEGTEFTDCVDIPVIRLFRNDPAIRYVGRVHELVEPVFEAKGFAWEQTKLVIHHYGKVVDALHVENKKKLYLELGRRKVQDNPQDGMAQFELGTQFFELKQYVDAIPPLEKAYSINPRRFDLALLYIAKAYHAMERMAEANRYYDKCLEVAGNDDRVLFEVANFRRDQGQLKSALKLYRKCLEINPKHALAMFNWGGVYLRLGKSEEGFGLMKRALKLNPDNEHFFESFGCLAAQGHCLEEAIQLLEQFLGRHPQNQVIPGLLAEMYFKLKQFDQATAWVEKALTLHPEQTSLMVLRAHCAFSVGRLAEAADAYQQVLNRHPGHLDSLMNLALIAEHQNDAIGMAAYLKSLLTEHPSHPAAAKKLAVALTRQSQNLEALEAMKRARELNPQDAECLILLGHLYEKHGQSHAALELYRHIHGSDSRLAALAKQKLLRLEAQLTAVNG
ncbi:MAG: tetratricopeptide repeat protein [Acidobacteriota bacterium]